MGCSVDSGSFPGGKIAEGETAEVACVRNIAEVVNLSVKNVRYLTRVRHAFTHFKIVVDVFQCDYQAGEVVLNGPRDAKWIAVGGTTGIIRSHVRRISFWMNWLEDSFQFSVFSFQ